MARPIKDGFDYFPFDTNFFNGDETKLLRAEFSAKGMMLIVYLLCEIYGKKGYYIDWNENKRFLVSDGAGCGCSPQLVQEFIIGCVRCGFFSQAMFEQHKILTSNDIQKRFIRMFNSREQIKVISEYFLLDINDTDDVPTSALRKLTFLNQNGTANPVKTTVNSVKTTVNTQKEIEKEKEIIINKIKSNENVVHEEIRAAWDAYIDFKRRIRFGRDLRDDEKAVLLLKLEDLAPNDYEQQNFILKQALATKTPFLY